MGIYGNINWHSHHGKEQKERGKWVPEGEWHCSTSEPNQPCFSSPQHWSFQLCEPINPPYFSSQFELGFSFLATEGRFGWLFANCHRNLEGKKIAHSCLPTIKSRYIMKAIGLHGNVSSDPHLLQIEETDCAKNSGQDLIAKEDELTALPSLCWNQGPGEDQDSDTWDKNTWVDAFEKLESSGPAEVSCIC